MQSDDREKQLRAAAWDASMDYAAATQRYELAQAEMKIKHAAMLAKHAELRDFALFGERDGGVVGAVQVHCSSFDTSDSEVTPVERPVPDLDERRSPIVCNRTLTGTTLTGAGLPPCECAECRTNLDHPFWAKGR